VGFPPCHAIISAKCLQKNSRGRGDVERIDVSSHGNIAEVMTEIPDFLRNSKILGAQNERYRSVDAGELIEGECIGSEVGADDGAGFREFVEVRDQVGAFSHGKAEEGTGRSSDRFGVEG